MSLAEALERAATAMPEHADDIRPSNGDPLQLLELLDDAGRDRVLEWLVRNEPDAGAELTMAWTEDERGHAPLLRLPDAELPKAGRKLLRRARHLLRSRGVDVGPVVSSEPVVARLPHIDDGIETAFLSDLDPRGSQVIFLVIPHPGGGVRFLQVLVDDERGIVEFELYTTGRSKARSFIKEVVRGDARFQSVEVDLGTAAARIHQVVSAHPADRPLPRGFGEWRARIAEWAKDTEVPGAQVAAALQAEEEPAAARRVADALRARSFGPWPPSRELLNQVGESLRSAAEGQVIVSESQQRDRIEVALVGAVEELFVGDEAARLAGRLRERAFVVWKLGRDEEARDCLSAGATLAGGALGENPVARAVLEVCLGPLIDSIREPKQKDEESSLLVKP